MTDADGAEPDLPGGFPHRLLHVLIRRFEEANPDAPPEMLDAYLEEEADALASLRDQLAQVAPEARDRVEAAIADGDVDGAASMLADPGRPAAATAAEVGAQATFHVTGAMLLLLAGDADAAARRFEAGAAALMPFAPERAAGLRHFASGRLFQHAEWFGGAGLVDAVAMLRRNEAIWTRAGHPDDWGRTQVCLGMALLALANQTEGADGHRLLVEAAAAHRGMVEVMTGRAAPHDRAMAHFTLGNTLLMLAARSGQPQGALAEMAAAFRAAREVRQGDARPEDWWQTQFEMGQRLLECAQDVDGTTAAMLYAEAVDAFRAVLVALGDADTVARGAARNNLASALNDLAAMAGEADAIRMLTEAAALHRAALADQGDDAPPDARLSSLRGLGHAAANLAHRSAGAEMAGHCATAVAAYRAALAIDRPEADPLERAEIELNLSLLLGMLAEHDPPGPRAEATACFEAARAAFEAHGTDAHRARCVDAGARLAAVLATPGPVRKGHR